MQLVVSLDAVGDDGEAGLPGFLVPAATELGGYDVTESLDESIDNFIGNMSFNLQLVKGVEFSLQRLRLVKERDGHLDQGQGAKGKGSELSGVNIIGSLGVEAVLGGGQQVENGSPDSFSEVFSAVSVRVRSCPLMLHLQYRQWITRVSRDGRHDPNEYNQSQLEHLHFFCSTSGQCVIVRL